MSRLLARPVDDRGVFLLDADALGLAEHLDGHVLELDAEIFRDQRASGEDRDVLEHRLAAVAEAGGLDGCDLEAAAQLVDDERRERLAVDVLGDDQERLAGLNDGLEHGKQRLERGELLLVDENVGLLEFGQHLLGVGDEVRREIAAVELHAFDDIELGIGCLGLFDRDDALRCRLSSSHRRSSCRSPCRRSLRSCRSARFPRRTAPSSPGARCP